MAQAPPKPGVNLVKWWPSGELTLNERLLFNAINDHDQAITTLATNGTTGSTTTQSITANSGGSNFSTSAAPGTLPGLGGVNNQSGITSHTTATTDNGALVIFNNASPIAVTLNSALTTPYYTTLSNQGPSTITVTPSTGLINGLASITIPGTSWATIYFDGINWEAESPGASVGGVNQIIAGTNITISPPSGVGAVTINSTGSGSGTILTASSSITVPSGGGTFTGTVSVPGAINTSVCVVQTTAPGIPFSGGGGSGNEIASNVGQVTGPGSCFFSLTLTPPPSTTFTAGTYPVTVKVIV
jgi:hypothetical protein